MIVLRRKKRDQIIINGNIVVTVMNIQGTRVSLGVQAPEGVRILRSELRRHDAPSSLPRLEAGEAAPESLPASS